ncbi:MAG: UbiD family decarboxylase [Gammaproteobacteria bacterium]|nr:UbiD family decarboxylase [Gammaproteobacteria bacterium]
MAAPLQQDLRRWLADARAAGELFELRGVDWNVEIGALAEYAGRQRRAPALLFDEIPGYPAGYRVLVNTLATPRRIAERAGIPPDREPLDALRLWKDRYGKVAHIPFRSAGEGPVLENRQLGADVDLFRFPAPKWRSGDGGRYLGTGTLCVTREPGTGAINVGTARVMIHDARHVFFRVSAGKDAHRHLQQARARNERLPIAISFGHDPSLLMVGGLNIAYGICEYDVWGGLTGEALQVVRTPLHELPVPSHAEIVVEGEVLPDSVAPEGPFGEWSGYYSRSARDEPLIRVQAVYHRDDPVILGIATSRPPSELTSFWSFFRSAQLWEQLERAGIGPLHGVWCHPAGGSRSFITIAVRQLHPGHARQALMAAASLPAGAYMGRYLVAVDDDVDPTDLDSVLWALSTRSDPERDIDLIRGAWGGPLDPAVGPEGRGLNSRLLIDACRPYGDGRQAPRVATYTRSEKDRAREIWDELHARQGSR